MGLTSFQKDFTVVGKYRDGGEERSFFTEKEVRELFQLLSYYLNDSRVSVVQLFDSSTAEILLYLYK